MAPPDTATGLQYTPTSPANGDLLQVEGLAAAYGRRQVVFDVSLHVRAGEAVTILGHNGAGKTTTLKAIFGLISPLAGTVLYRGVEVRKMSCAQRVREGISYVPAQRFVFADLTVADNLRLGALTEKDDAVSQERLARVHEIFPILAERRTQTAGTMSGGQQRILSIGVALMSGPSLILLDEPSLGLAPAVFQQISDVLRSLVNEQSVSIVLLEQNVLQALRVANRVYIMRSGRVILEETAEQMGARDHWWDLF